MQKQKHTSSLWYGQRVNGWVDVNVCKTHGRILSMSLKPSGVLQPEGMCACARSSSALSLVQVMWTRLCSEMPPPPFSVPPPPSVSSSSSEPMLVKRSVEFLSFTSCAYTQSNLSFTFSQTRALHSQQSIRETLPFFFFYLTLSQFSSVLPSPFTPSVFFFTASLCMGLQLILY